MHRTKLLGAALLASIVGAASVASSCVSRDEKPVDGELPAPPEPVTALEPQPAPMRRLLRRQYVNSVRSLFGAQAASVANPPDDTAVNGFEAIGARQLTVSDYAVNAYEVSARAVAAEAVKNKARIANLLDCEPAGVEDAACHRSFVTRLGRLAFRRPLTPGEVDRYAAIAQSGALELKDFYAGLELAITAFLQSPSFLYMVEAGEPIEGGARRLIDYELLARMSYFLLDSPPDAALLDFVAAEGLRTEGQIRFVASAMLERLDARDALSSFFGELYRLRDLTVIAKDKDLFPQFTPALAEAMQQETRRTIEDVIWERDVDFREMFTTDYTFVNADLAALYGVKAPTGGIFEKVSLPAEQDRGGVLGHAGLLARFAHTTTTSPTLRGKFVREKLLCQTVPPPPPEVATTLAPENPMADPKTLKEKLQQHQNDPTCSYCHKLMDNVGLAFENFDAVGAYRTLDNGLPIDASTETEDLGAFSSPKELGAVLRDDPDVAMCLVRNLYRNALGHLETEGEEESLMNIAAAFAGSGFRVRELLVEIVASPAFRTVGVSR